MNTSDFKNSVVNVLPDILESDFEPLNKNYLKVIFINISIFFIAFFLIIFIASIFELDPKINQFSSWGYLTLSILFVLFCAFFTASFYRRNYLLREKDISYQRGVFVHSLTTVPFSRIQHVEIDEGPVSRMFKLASLSVYTAGDSSDDLEIKGIKREVAFQIKEFISSKINE